MWNKKRLYQIVFESDTRAGKGFDILLIWSIVISVLVVMLDSINVLQQRFAALFLLAEWFFTILYTLEYLLRIYISVKPGRYIFSFWGLIDLLAIFPTYFSLLVPGYQYFLVVRILRVFRIFRILKLYRFNKEALTLMKALKASAYKISIFLSVVLSVVVLLGTIMYAVEGPENGYTSIPQSIYWAIITITTVGYGDIVPQTTLGKMISSLTMLIGYSIIAVPTGIVTFEMARAVETGASCGRCGSKNNKKARFCSNCGKKLTRKP
ncbi:ion transporter [bacterium]|nr:ion transporter [bacterium]